MYGKETLEPTNDKHAEDVKILSEAREPLLDLDKCSLNELISIVEKFVVNYVIKEKIQRYNNDAPIPPKLGMCGFPRF
jgi:hypothetical protein